MFGIPTNNNLTFWGFISNKILGMLVGSALYSFCVHPFVMIYIDPNFPATVVYYNSLAVFCGSFGCVLFLILALYILITPHKIVTDSAILNRRPFVLNEGHSSIRPARILGVREEDYGYYNGYYSYNSLSLYEEYLRNLRRQQELNILNSPDPRTTDGRREPRSLEEMRNDYLNISMSNRNPIIALTQSDGSAASTRTSPPVANPEPAKPEEKPVDTPKQKNPTDSLEIE